MSFYTTETPPGYPKHKLAIGRSGAPHGFGVRKGPAKMPSASKASPATRKVIGTGEGCLTELSTAELKELFPLREEAVVQ